MLNSRWTTWKRIAHRATRRAALRTTEDTRGSEIAESAMLLPLFFMIFMAIFWFGQAYRIYGTLTQGARAGAEAAIAPACTTCAATTPATNAQSAIYNALQSAHLDKNNLVPIGGWTRPNLCACGGAGPSCVATAAPCAGGVNDVCVQENVQLSYPSNGGMGTCGTSVSARYRLPYHFYLPCASWPCTSLDLGTMMLPGQAQMREETQ